MSVYTPPALDAVNFALTAHTPVASAPATQVLVSYTPPALTAVDFALVAYTVPTYVSVGWELLPDLSFPTQVPGLRVYYGGAVRSLCLVAVADAPAGDMLRVRKGSTTYALYLVSPSNPDASAVRVRTAEGTRAIRLLT